MRNTFQLPKPILIKEVKARSRNSNVARDGKDLKVKGQTSLSRPEFIPHICKSESNCEICRSFINEQ